MQSKIDKEKALFIQHFKEQHPTEYIISPDDLSEFSEDSDDDIEKDEENKPTDENKSTDENEQNESEFVDEEDGEILDKEIEEDKEDDSLDEVVGEEIGKEMQVIQRYFRKKWEKLVFKRVETVDKSRNDIEKVIYYYIMPLDVIKQLQGLVNVFELKTCDELIEKMKEKIKEGLEESEEYWDIIEMIKFKKFSNFYEIWSLVGRVIQRTYKDLHEAIEYVPKKYHRNLQVYYYKYHGYTETESLNKLDPTRGKAIYFQSSNFAEINFDVNSPNCFEFNPRQNYPIAPNHYVKRRPPSKDTLGQLLCGLVEKTRDGYEYTKWFICSSQFYQMWLMFFDPTNPLLTGNLKKQILNLSTSKIWNLYSMGIRKRVEKYTRRYFESVAMDYSDRYQIIARLAFIPSFLQQWQAKILDRQDYNTIHTFSPIPPFYEEKILFKIFPHKNSSEPKRIITINKTKSPTKPTKIITIKKPIRTIIIKKPSHALSLPPLQPTTPPKETIKETRKEMTPVKNAKKTILQRVTKK